tara:strand:+ start:6050 stop:6811 length:762 start_codon:yes stop_codon:yes gene_type:complete
MVNKTLKNIDFLLKNKEQINDSELAYLFDLTVKYPFSSFCHYVVFSVLKKQNRTGYENMLKKTAIRFHNRIYLEQLANNLDLNIGKETAKSMDERIHGNEEYPNEDVKTLNENIYGNLIAENIIHEVEEPKTKDDLIEPKTVNKNTPKSFEDWLFKEPIPSTSKEVTVDEILQSLENRKNQSSKTSFFSASESAKKSLELNNDIVTETLAEIHVQQGNYPKAIEIYQKLMLLNPEKKLFFASRIEFINQKTKL